MGVEQVEVAELEAAVRHAYRARRPLWHEAQRAVEAWLRALCADALLGRDESRLDVAPGRIKEQDRTVAKLRRLLAAGEPWPAADADDDLAVERVVRDVVGVKVLCKSERDQMLFDRHLEAQGPGAGIAVLAKKDYVAVPKPSGYRALHYELEVAVADGAEPVIVEVQVKTRLQDAWSELTHEDLYKPGGALRAGEFHQSIAETMANLLREVDRLAGTLASEIESTLEAPATPAAPAATSGSVAWQRPTTVQVVSTGPRFALAVDETGQRGLIRGQNVRSSAGAEGYVSVQDYLEVGMTLRVQAIEEPAGVFFVPAESLARLDERAAED
ncbi:(p)ppGpp synthetase [Agrococcus sp. SL85]|uniref:(p)ppGpp synthetase n=1 Tax=Agrococcus sp. SL85 TaxID=2995141 RepID=UPI00226CE6A8|nr:(p)ppGpp synthetase [Agrococcus sp. SL85]WAC66221.1 (p)ppGpp synthetase [Agrococcus sp. SL85]